MFDFTYYTDTAVRILNGQVPYRDFTLFANPGSYLQLATAIGLVGRSYQSIFLLLAIQSVAICLLVTHICRRLSENSTKSATLTLVSIAASVSFLNIYSIFFQPYYDADATLAMLLSGAIVAEADRHREGQRLSSSVLAAAAGVLAFLPYFYKQTFGLPWIAVLAFAWIIAVASGRWKTIAIPSLAGFLGSSCGFFAYLAATGSLGDWYSLTVEYPLRIRNSSYFALLDQLKADERLVLLTIGLTVACMFAGRTFRPIRSQLWKVIPLVVPAALFIVSSASAIASYGFSVETVATRWTLHLPYYLFAIMLFTLVALIGSTRTTAWTVIGLALGLALVSGWLSQGFVGSSHATWPAIVVVVMISTKQILSEGTSPKEVRTTSGLIGVSVTVLLVGALSSALALSRYSWLGFEGEARRIDGLSWVSTPGTTANDTAISVALFTKYSALGRTAVFPGEEPVAFLTGRLPATDVSASDPSTNPMFRDVERWLKNNGVEFLISRADGQAPGMSNSIAPILAAATSEMRLVESAPPFSVYQVDQ